MRLNGWQRIGVVVSVLWIVLAAVYVRNLQVAGAKEIFAAQHYLCVGEVPRRDCSHLELRLKPYATEVGDIAFFALAPVIAGWLMAWLWVRVFRWIRAGFGAP